MSFVNVCKKHIISYTEIQSLEITSGCLSIVSFVGDLLYFPFYHILLNTEVCLSYEICFSIFSIDTENIIGLVTPYGVVDCNKYGS